MRRAGPEHADCPECGGRVAVPAGHSSVRCGHCGSKLLHHLGLRGRAALVSLRCTDCGAAVECPEDAQALRCGWCGSAQLLLETGRISDFMVPASLGAEEARAALLSRFGVRAGSPELWLLPYWRFRTMVYRWELGRDRGAAAGAAGLGPSGLELLTRRLDAAGGREPPDPSTPLFGTAGREGGPERRLAARAVDRSLLAGEFGFGPPSLGLRLHRVNQLPFSAEGAEGRLAAPRLPAEEARARLSEWAVEAARDPRIARELERGSLVGTRLSLVRYPFWLFRDGERRWAVDAAGGDYAGEARPAPASGEVRVASRPPKLAAARCPRCDGDFEVEAFSAVHFCRACLTGWRPVEGRLAEQPALGVSPRGDAAPDAHLPLWRLRVALTSGGRTLRDQAGLRELVPDWGYTGRPGDPGKPACLYVPGWGNRVSPRFSAAAKRLTREQPELPPAPPRFERVLRALFGPAEAAELSILTLLGVSHSRTDVFQRLLDSRLEVEACELLLLPARRGAREWVDDATGLALHDLELGERRWD